MHRVQIVLEDAQYKRLCEQSRVSGVTISGLVHQAVLQTYGSSTLQERLQALDDSFGSAAEDEFDERTSVDFVDRQRSGLSHRLTSPGED